MQLGGADMDKIPCQLDKSDFQSLDDARIKNFDTDIVGTITARYYKGIGANGDNMVIEKEVKQIGNMDNDRENFENPQCGRVYDCEGLSPTINTCQGGQREPKIIVAMRGRNPDNPSDRTAGSPTEQRLEPNSQGICNTLTSVQKDNLLLENICINDSGFSEKEPQVSIGTVPTLRTETHRNLSKVMIKQATKEGYIECNIGGVADLSYPESDTRSGRVQGNGEISPTITSTETGICRIESLYRIRKLTPFECWSLMGFLKMDFLSAKLGSRQAAKETLEKYPHLGKRAFTEVQRVEKMSNSQLYKQAGNSIVKNVLVAIFGQMIPGKENAYKNEQ